MVVVLVEVSASSSYAVHRWTLMTDPLGRFTVGKITLILYGNIETATLFTFQISQSSPIFSGANTRITHAICLFS